jgi:hypothetical protein
MSWNTRLLPTKRLAASRVERDREGQPLLLPRVVERRPRQGDVHPLNNKYLSALLRYQRIDYLYGLRQIELRPRVSAQVGDPYGLYRRRERLIVLYSVPPARWRFPALGPSQRRNFEAYDAVVSEETDGVWVAWPRLFDLAFFTYQEVLLHELGHHHDYQYRHKRKLPRGRRWKEESAEEHKWRLSKTRGWGLWCALQRQGLL